MSWTEFVGQERERDTHTHTHRTREAARLMNKSWFTHTHTHLQEAEARLQTRRIHFRFLRRRKDGLKVELHFLMKELQGRKAWKGEQTLRSSPSAPALLPSAQQEPLASALWTAPLHRTTTPHRPSSLPLVPLCLSLWIDRSIDRSSVLPSLKRSPLSRASRKQNNKP